MLNKKGVYFSLSSLSMSILTMVTNILTIFWISPDFMGIWNAYFIFVSYVYFFQLGTVNGLSRELPYFLGKKRNNIAIALARTSLSVIKYNTIIVFLLGSIAIFVLYFFYNISTDFLKTAISVLILMVLQFYNNYLLSTFRSNNSFKNLTIIYSLMAVVICSSVLLVKFYDYNGHLVRIPLIALVQIFLLHIFRPLKIKPNFKKIFFSILIKTGLPLFVFNYFTLIANTFNRLIILQFGTTLQLGLYTPAIAINSAMRLIPLTLFQYIYPKLSFMMGETNSSNLIWEKTKKIALLMLLLLSVIALIAYFLVEWFIDLYFPEYVDGIFASKMAILSGVFSGVSVAFTTSLNTVKAFKYIGSLSVSRMVLFYVVLYLFAINMNVLDGVAYGLVISELIYLLISIGFNYKYFKIDNE